jgi:hypothetical protein
MGQECRSAAIHCDAALTSSLYRLKPGDEALRPAPVAHGEWAGARLVLEA